MRIQREMPGEVRAVERDGGQVLEGHAAVFNQWTDIGGMFQERIAPTAFDELAGYDTVALFNHDPNNILGRVGAGTLRLATDEQGLAFEIDVDGQDDIGRRVARKVERGELWGNSFAFTIADQEWKEDEDGQLWRTITGVETLYDVGPVTYPAYEQTDVALRAEEELAEYADEIVRKALEELDDLDPVPVDRTQQNDALRLAARLRAIAIRR